MKEWSVVIEGIGMRKVESKDIDIDGAYDAAMDEFGCEVDDVLAVFCHSPVEIKEEQWSVR
jgi:hypothetical protein